MKKFLLIAIMLLTACALFAASPNPVTFGTWTSGGGSGAVVTITASSVFTIIAQDDGNTTPARSIYVWDSTGNTKMTRTFSVGQVVPAAVLPNQFIGCVGQNPVNIYSSAVTFTSPIYIKSDFKYLILTK